MTKKIVTIGGGTGQSLLLSAIRDISGIEISSIVSMFDSGGSTGRLIKEFGILPPGDIMKCVLALSPNREGLEEFLKYRFEKNSKLRGHSLGNLLLLILNQYSGNFVKGVEALSEALQIRGKVIPVSKVSADIVATLEDGEEIFGETNIDISKSKRSPIKNIKIVTKNGDDVIANEEAVEAIKKANYMIVSLGDFYTSIVPNLVIAEISEVCKNYKGKIIYIVNSLKKKGETDNFVSKDYILNLEKYLGRKIDFAIFNDCKLNFKTKKEINNPIKEDNWENRVIIKEDIHDDSVDYLRYDGVKLAKVINKIINNK
jgi:uncharacterized cofD-like protein